MTHTIKFTYTYNYDKNGPRRRTDKITIQEHGHGWEWDSHDGEGFSAKTNEEGDGLWWFDHSQGGWQQQLGTVQFSLPRDAHRAFYKLAKLVARTNSVGGEFADLEVEYL